MFTRFSLALAHEKLGISVHQGQTSLIIIAERTKSTWVNSLPHNLIRNVNVIYRNVTWQDAKGVDKTKFPPKASTKNVEKKRKSLIKITTVLEKILAVKQDIL